MAKWLERNDRKEGDVNDGFSFFGPPFRGLHTDGTASNRRPNFASAPAFSARG